MVQVIGFRKKWKRFFKKNEILDEPFHYPHLASNHIRLLTVHSITETTIICTLSTHSLKSDPTFHALSYAWGTDPPTEKIYILDPVTKYAFYISVTPTVASALSSLHNLTKPIKPSLLWVDSICINQSSDAEKSLQVPLMASIYSSASRVMIWLGPAADSSDLAMSAFPRLHEYFSKSENQRPFPRIPESFTERGLPDFDGPVWNALASLSARPWFQRLWAMQEIGLAQEATFVCGAETVDWKIVSEVALGMNNSKLHRHMLRGRERRLNDGWDPLLHMAELQNNKFRWSFAHLLFLGTRKQCSEPVDRIYGVLGLANEDVRRGLNIDYGKVKTEGYQGAYIEAAKCALNKDRNLDLLGVTSSLLCDESLPSWCPSFQPDEERTPLRVNYRAGVFPLGKNRKGYNTISKNEVFFPPSQYQLLLNTPPESDIIHISGTEVDTITSIIDEHSWLRITNPLKFKGSSGDASDRLIWLSTTLKKAQEVYQTEDNHIPDQYIRTLVGDGLYHTKDPENLWGDSKIDARRKLYNVCMEVLRWWAQARVKTANPCPPEDLGALDIFWQSMSNLWRKRVFIITKGGRIGAASPTVQVGDSILVLFGGEPVYVGRRREESETWRFLGEAYVDGLMYGEVFDLLEKGEAKQEMISFD